MARYVLSTYDRKGDNTPDFETTPSTSGLSYDRSSPPGRLDSESGFGRSFLT